MEKKEIREKYLLERNKISAEVKNNLDKVIFEKLINNKIYQDANIIFSYVSIDNEVDTISIIETALKEGKKVAVPKTFKKGVMKFYYIQSLEDLYIAKFNLLEPKNLNNEASPDNKTLFLVPGIVFDSSKNRIGFGAGYYDRYLCKFPYYKTIALAYEFQVLDSIPTDNNDIKMDMIFTEENIYT